MLDAFGQFAVVFEPMGDDRTPYLCLLHLHDERSVNVVNAIRGATEHDSADNCIVTLLRDVDWRPHLVGAIAAHFRPSANAIAQMWAALDAGSWVTPQLAAILTNCDSAFRDRALDRLNSLCPHSNDPEYSIESPIERHSAQGPAGSHHRSAKSAASLSSLLKCDCPDHDLVKTLDVHAKLQQLIGDDFDNSGDVAISWRRRFLELAALV